MDRKLYETIIALTELAVDGKDARERDADGPEDRRAIAEAEGTIIMGQHYVREYEEQYRNGDLK